MPAALHVQRDQLLAQQPIPRLDGKALQVQRRALLERRAGANVVDARQKAAYPFQHLGVVQLGPASAAARADGKQEVAVLVQAAAIQPHGRDHRDFGRNQFGGEIVLFLNLRLAPTPGAVELEHHRFNRRQRIVQRLVQVRQVDAVLVGVQRHLPAVAQQTDPGQRVGHAVRGQVLVGMQQGTGRVGHACIVALCRHACRQSG